MAAKKKSTQLSLFSEAPAAVAAVASGPVPAPPPAAPPLSGGAAPEPASRRGAEPRSAGDRDVASAMAKKQREISISEFFTKNRHLLGFDNPKKALLTTIKEAVDNSLDACEEARILPSLEVAVTQLAENRYSVAVTDNGPGIVKQQIPKIFGKLLYGSKFHTMKQSLTSEQKVLVERGGEVSWIPIGDLVDVVLCEGQESLDVSRLGWRAPAFSPETGAYAWAPVSHVIRHPRAHEVLEIRTEGGRRVRVTGCHSLFSWDPRLGIVAVEARTLRRGSFVVAPKRLPDVPLPAIDRINVLASLSESDLKRRWLYVYGLPSRLLERRRAGARVVHRKGKDGRSRRYYRLATATGPVDVLDDSFRQYVDKGFLPAWLVKRLGLERAAAGSCLRSYHHGRPVDVPVTWRLSPALMRMLGLFVAEGHTDRRQIGFTLSDTEDALAGEIERSARYLGLSTSRERRPRHAQRVKVFGGATDLLFAAWCGRGAKNKKVPSFVFRASRELRQHFLDGLHQGDGHRVEGRPVLMLGSGSSRLIDDVQVLWLLQGVCASRSGPYQSRGLGKGLSESWRLDVHGRDINVSNVFGASPGRADNRYRLFPAALLGLGLRPHGRIRTDAEGVVRAAGLGTGPAGPAKASRLVMRMELERTYAVEDLRELADARVTRHLARHMVELGYLEENEGGFSATSKLADLKREVGTVAWLAASDLCLLRVEQVTPVDDPSAYVYDLSVPGCENFVAGTGALACHNSRGQQGIGISAAGMYGQLTTGKPIRITSKTESGKAHYYEIHIDTRKNNPEVIKDEMVPWDVTSGTRVELELEAVHKKGRHSVDDYLRQTALANPHAEIRYRSPDGEELTFPRATEELPVEPKEIKPHPHGVELGALILMMQETKARTLAQFLKDDFARVSPKVALEILQKAGLDPGLRLSKMDRVEAEKLHRAIPQVKIMAPPTNCISPIGEALIQKGLEQKVKADFYVATTRPPAVYRGNPFQVEVGLAWGGDLKADEPIELYRFANRVPLQYQQSACAITRGVMATPWRNYAIQQPKGALPLGPMVLMVHMASVWVPFTSESKEAVAHYPEILKEIKLALMECGRKLGAFLSRRRRDIDEQKKRSYIDKYLPHVGIALKEILGLSDRAESDLVDSLRVVLERSRSHG